MQILRHSKIAVTMEIYTEVPSAAPAPRSRGLVSGSAASPVAVLQRWHGDENASYKIATGR
jgi:hypothetical protein